MGDGERPNILVIWGDDIGITNLSCYSDGLMGHRTPNIGRIADEGMRFTDSYGGQSLHHLNAEEEPELPNWRRRPTSRTSRERLGPRGVLHSWVTEEDDDTEEPRWGRVGRQRIDTGPLTKKGTRSSSTPPTTDPT